MESCVCDGSGTTPDGPCSWCNAGEEQRIKIGLDWVTLDIANRIFANSDRDPMSQSENQPT